ncbi:hypothetical protein [Pseudomonas carnis]|uniref:hypothetical protein n=1 Tax=Pseudomonas carnis TaxID=2487355 RepID=UPI001BC9A4B5|nr:hypothetical protein [Pseudomonas carnis]
MKRTDDPTGLQFLFTGAVAICLVLQAIGIFAYRLYTQRFDDQQVDHQDEQQ